MRRDRSKSRGALERIPSPVSPTMSPATLPSTLPPWPPLPAALYGGPSAKRGAGVGAFLLAIVTAGALAHVGVRIKGLQVAYDLGSERRITTELEEQRRRLQIEIGMLKDPGRVISIARDKLQMGPPASEAIWRLGSDAAPKSGGAVPAAAFKSAGSVPAAAFKSTGSVPAAAFKSTGSAPAAAFKLAGPAPAVAAKSVGQAPAAAFKSTGSAPAAAVKSAGSAPAGTFNSAGSALAAAFKSAGQTPAVAFKSAGQAPAAAPKSGGPVPITPTKSRATKRGRR